MIFNEIKCHVNTSLGPGGHPMHPPCVRACLGQVLDWLLRLHVSQTTTVRTFALCWHSKGKRISHFIAETASPNCPIPNWGCFMQQKMNSTENTKRASEQLKQKKYNRALIVMIQMKLEIIQPYTACDPCANSWFPPPKFWWRPKNLGGEQKLWF